jgi:hypothetical protein
MVHVYHHQGEQNADLKPTANYKVSYQRETLM